MVVAAILAAGSGSRFGGDKVKELVGGRPLWWHSYRTFLAHPEVDRVIVVVSAECESVVLADEPRATVVRGGASRQASARAALDACDGEILLFHDGARPGISGALISEVIAAVRRSGAAAPACPVSDTIRRRTDEGLELLDRRELFAMQTPQGAWVRLWREAHRLATTDATDDLALLEAIGVTPELVPGDPRNFKVTHPDDLDRARAMLAPVETRTGLGYDVHRFSTDPSRPLMLGGVLFEGEMALEGHSDADVLVHAAVDALLGAAALGDIGQHFPPSDEKWRGEPSLTFLRHAASLLRMGGWTIVNLDIAAIAERPKLMPRALEMRTLIASCLEIELDRVSIKATTNEGLGSIGRGEGISAFATATIRR